MVKKYTIRSAKKNLRYGLLSNKLFLSKDIFYLFNLVIIVYFYIELLLEEDQYSLKIPTTIESC